MAKSNRNDYQIDPATLARPEFINNLKVDLADRLTALHRERNMLDEQAKAIEVEAGRIRAAYGILNV